MTPTRRLGLASLVAMALAGCNMITGSESLVVGDEDDEDGVAFGPPGETTPVEGMGGAAAATGAGTTVASTGVGGAAASSAASSGAGAGPTVCEYPTGPYGVAQGSIVPPSLSWSGFVPGSNTPTTFTAEDLFDCDGSRGIHAVVVDTSQYG